MCVGVIRWFCGGSVRLDGFGVEQIVDLEVRTGPIEVWHVQG